jgi:hypothetical protein
MSKKNTDTTITKTATYGRLWGQDIIEAQYTDLETFLKWVKQTIQGAAPTSDGVRLIVQTKQGYDGDEHSLLLSWQEQENKTSKKVQKVIGKIKQKGKKK